MTVINSTILARHRWPGQVSRPARTWVVHDMEAPEQSTIAEGVGNYFRTTSRVASTHFGVDNNSVVRYAYDGDKVAAAYGLNHDSIHVEHAGYARQTKVEWLDKYGVDMLELSAKLFVEVGYKQHGIPPVLLTAAQTADRSKRGITSHVNSTRGWGVSGGHTDPGENFPWTYYMSRIHAHIKGTAGAVKPVVDKRVLKRPMRGAEVSEWQQDLNKVLFYKLGTGGKFGRKTEAATILFQKDAKLQIDGIVGPVTRNAMTEYHAKKKKITFRLASFVNVSPSTVTAPYPGSPIKMGDHGPNVRRIQQWLEDKGYRLTIDGAFGPQTDRVVRKFQGANGINQHGRVNERTWNNLARLSAK